MSASSVNDMQGGEGLSHPRLDAWATRCAAAIAARLPSWPGVGIWLLLVVTLVAWNIFPRSESQRMSPTLGMPTYTFIGWPAMNSFELDGIALHGRNAAELQSPRGFAINLLVGVALSGLVYGLDRMFARRAFSLRNLTGVVFAAALLWGSWAAARSHNIQFVQECNLVTMAAQAESEPW
jgi:hypothetical protein